MRRVLVYVLPVLMVLGPACSCQEGPINQLSGKISLGAGVLDFGKVCLGDTVTRALDVSNAGTVPLHIKSVTFSGTNVYAVTDFPKTLAPAGQTGDSGQIKVSFAPTTAGDAFGSLVVESDDKKTPKAKVNVTGKGDDGVRVDIHLECEDANGTSLSDCPSVVDFGDVAKGASKDVPIVLDNKGCAVLTVTDYKITDLTGGPTPAGFSVTGPDKPFTFSGKDPQTVVPTLTPPTVDTYAGRLAIDYTDKGTSGSVTPALGLVGNGIDLQLIVQPSSFVFAQADVNTPQTETFTIQNTGGQSGQITAIDVQNGTPQFTVNPSSTLPATIAGYSSFDFDVTFAPTDAGKVADAIVVTSNAGSLPPVPISGGAVPQIEVTPPTTVDFGQVATGGTATEQVQVSNVGKANLNVTGVTLTQNPASVFSFQNLPTFPQTLAPNASFTFSVKFVDNPTIGKAPDGSGQSEVGELTIQSDDPAYATSDYLLVLQTDTMANFGPTAVLTTTVAGTVCTAQPCSVTQGDTVTLDASGSTDPENDPLTYAWTITQAPTGATATLSATTGPTVTLAPDFPGRWSVKVTVSDPYKSSDFATTDLGVQ